MDEFLRMAAGLKKIPRQGWIDKAGISNPESVADHSYSMTVMAMMFGDNAGMDTCKMIRMALLHDIVESITGDLTPEIHPFLPHVLCSLLLMRCVMFHRLYVDEFAT